jgi:hypothetical protein
LSVFFALIGFSNLLHELDSFMASSYGDVINAADLFAMIKDMYEVLSPGGWDSPQGTKPGWNWTPPGGIIPDFKRAPLRARFLESLPYLDRFIYPWMWNHGYFLVHRPGAKPDYSSGAITLPKMSKTIDVD